MNYRNQFEFSKKFYSSSADDSTGPFGIDFLWLNLIYHWWILYSIIDQIKYNNTTNKIQWVPIS